MFQAILNIVLLMSSVILSEAKQNFRFSPTSTLAPGGRQFFLHKLWKVRFLGWRDNGDSVAAMAMLKCFL
jgi:hypothetical protein